MKSYDFDEEVKGAAQVPWYNFMVPHPLPPFKKTTSLEDANWYAAAYSSEVRNLQIGRAFWAWTSIFLAVVAAIGWLR